MSFLALHPHRVGVGSSGSPCPVASQWHLKVPQLQVSALGWTSVAGCPLLFIPTVHLPELTAQEQRPGCCWERDPGQLPALLPGRHQMQRPWLQPAMLGPACHMLGAEPRSGEQACPAGLLAPGAQEAEQRTSYPRWRKRREGLSHWDGACGGGGALGSWLWVSQGSRWGDKGRVGGSQEESGCQPARMGLLRAADGGLGPQPSPQDRARPGGRQSPSLAAPVSLGRRAGMGAGRVGMGAWCRAPGGSSSITCT